MLDLAHGQLPDLLTPHEVAHMLRLSHDSVYRLIRCGELPGLRVARRAFRIPRHAVEAVLAGRYPTPQNATPEGGAG